MRSIILGVALVLAGCAVTPPPPPETFPPALGALTQGDFEAFLAENRHKQLTCTATQTCATVLFNLGFVYAYPYSPYYDRKQALLYFDELLQNHAETPWALQGRWWSALLHETLTLEAARERLQADLKAQKEAMRAREEVLQARIAALRSRESTIRSQETTIRTKEAMIRSQDAAIRDLDAAIRDLQTRLERSREIDAHMDKKERDLLP